MRGAVPIDGDATGLKSLPAGCVIIRWSERQQGRATGKISWSSCSGPKNRGAVLLEPLPTFGTRVTMEIHYDPTGFIEEVTDYLGVFSRWVEQSLGRFKDVIEQPHSMFGRLPSAEELVGQ